MAIRRSKGKIVFDVCNYIFLSILSLTCLFPIIHVLSISLSSVNMVDAGKVSIFPIGFNLEAYKYVMGKQQFLRSFVVSVQRVVIGVLVNMLITFFAAYPLSKSTDKFRKRTLYVWIFVITMIFSGGLIPTYLVIHKLGLIDKFWALILPGAVPVYNIVLMLNFFRGIPDDFEDAAFIDGAGHFRILKNIYIPLALPSIATLTLFCAVSHWNAWFDGMLYMNSPAKYPLQSYLRTLVIEMDITVLTVESILQEHLVNNRTQRAAQIFVAMIPILLVYPFLQRYFISGMTLGGVKE